MPPPTCIQILAALSLDIKIPVDGPRRYHEHCTVAAKLGGLEVFTLGNATIQKIHETNLNGFALTQLLPEMDEQMPYRHPAWVPPGTTDGDKAVLSVHSWLLRHESMIILVDTGAGNDKSRPQQKILDHLNNPFMDRLAAVGIKPEMVDYVLHTHVHSDHVGWNTRLVDGHWKPTFPRAIHICSKLEWSYGSALADRDEQGIASARSKAGLGEPVRIPVSGTFDDSMRPLQATGQMRLVEINGEEVLPGLRFLSTPGHSIDHAAIELTSNGQVAIFGGDVMHHLLELYNTELVSSFCEFPDAARRSRRSLLERSVGGRALYLSAHFPLSSAGRITKDSKGFHWVFADDEDVG